MNWYLKVIEKYTVFSGRARRKEYWMFTLFNIIFFTVAIIFDYALIDAVRWDISLFSYIYILSIFIPWLAVSVRRLHDIGKSAWVLFIVSIPIVGLIWLLVLMANDSNPGENKYGSNPKENI